MTHPFSTRRSSELEFEQKTRQPLGRNYVNINIEQHQQKRWPEFQSVEKAQEAHEKQVTHLPVLWIRELAALISQWQNRAKGDVAGKQMDAADHCGFPLLIIAAFIPARFWEGWSGT